MSYSIGDIFQGGEDDAGLGQAGCMMIETVMNSDEFKKQLRISFSVRRIFYRASIY